MIISSEQDQASVYAVATKTGKEKTVIKYLRKFFKCAEYVAPGYVSVNMKGDQHDQELCRFIPHVIRICGNGNELVPMN